MGAPEINVSLAVMFRSANPDRWRAAVLEAAGWGEPECRIALHDSDSYRMLPGALRLCALRYPGTPGAGAWAYELALALAEAR